MDCDLVGAAHREVVALLVEAKGLVDAHAGGADDASQVALCQAQVPVPLPGRGVLPLGGASSLIGKQRPREGGSSEVGLTKEIEGQQATDK